MQQQTPKVRLRGLQSLRAKVALLLVVVMAAMMATVAYQAYRSRLEITRGAFERLSTTARLAAQEQSTNTSLRVERVLSSLTESRDIDQLATDPNCPGYLDASLKREPRFTNIAIIDPGGNFSCSAVPAADRLNVGDRDYFKAALTNRLPVIGEPVYGRVTGKWTLPYAIALRDDGGRVRHVVLVALDLQWLSEQMAPANLSGDARMGLIDGKGLVVVRFPDPEKWVGRNASDTPFFKTMKAVGGAGTAESVGFDGISRIYGFARFADTVAGPINLWVGVSKNSVVGMADRQLAWTLLSALLFLAVILAAAWWGGERLLLQPVTAIADAARRLSEGGPLVRTGVQHTNTELGQLARTFDEMAESLASTNRLLRANRALRILTGINQALVHAADERGLLDEVCRAIVQAGGFRMAWVGYAEDDDRKTVRPVAVWGAEPGYLDGLRVSWADTELGAGPTGRAIREQAPIVMRNAQTDPQYAPWRDAAVRYGYGSTISLPLLADGRAIGALNIYAAEPDAFGDEEVAMLSEAASDLGFGIGGRRTQAKLHEADIRLRDSAQYARSLLEASLDPLVTINAGGKITDVNEATVKATGAPREALIGTDFADYFTEPQNAREGYKHAFSKGFVTDYPLTVRHKDGHLIDVLYNASVYRDARGNILGVFAAARDVTARMRAEVAIRELNASLEQRVVERTTALKAANRELEAFAYSVSHDLRAPLRSIDGFSKILQEDYAGKVDDEGKDALQRVRAAAQKMGLLIDDLLKLSRLTRADMHAAPVDLAALARSIAGELKAKDPDRNTVVEIPSRLEVFGDKRLLAVLLENLFGNAWKFTSRHDAARITLGATDKDGSVAYFVRDDGAGFDMAYVNKLFSPFQRLHGAAEFPGTGIGLATVRRIVQRHGGKVWAEGGVEKGATFYFTLPAGEATTLYEEPEAAQA